MPGKIVNRFRVLLAEKAEKEQKNIPLKEVERQTGITWTTLQSWANNKVTRFDAPVIIALCDYLECEVGDLLVYRKEE
jgi:putative transcriptional regulator